MTGDGVTSDDLIAHASALLETNRYATLGTAAPDGQPWTTPVYFAPGPGWRFYWMSETRARHSRNLAERPEISLVVFDSTVAPYHGRAVYAVGRARELRDDEVAQALESYPGPSRRGVPPMTRDDLTGSAAHRLYRATASELWVLCPRAPSRPCPLHGIASDHRARVK